MQRAQNVKVAVLRATDLALCSTRAWRGWIPRQTTSHYLSIHVTAVSAAPWPPFKGTVFDSQLGAWGLIGEIYGLWSCANWKPTYDFPIIINTKLCDICYLPPFDRNCSVKLYSHPINCAPFCTNRNFDPTFLFDFCAHWRPILHRFGVVHFCPGWTDWRIYNNMTHNNTVVETPC